MVLRSQFTSYSKSNHEGKTQAESSRQSGESTQTYHTSCVEVLKVANSFLIPNCDPQTIGLITDTVRQSSESDYQRKWQTFLRFTESKGIAFNDIEKGVVINFLSHLFHTKGLRPSTVSHYKSAVSRPLKDYFNIDLTCDLVSSLLKGMKVKRPPQPTPKIL